MPPRKAQSAETDNQSLFSETLQSLEESLENHDIDATIAVVQGFLETLDTEGKSRACQLELGPEAARIFCIISQTNCLPLNCYASTMNYCHYMFNPYITLPDNCHLEVVPHLSLEDRKNLTIGILSSALQIITAPAVDSEAKERRLNHTWIFNLSGTIPHIVRSVALGAFRRRRPEDIF